MEGLVALDPATGELENRLAESIEPSEDGLEISFTLQKNIQWQKGYGELTTEDVKYSFERFAELESGYASDWEALDHVEVIDDYQGKIILKEPQASLWTITLPLTSGYIVSKKYVEEVGLDTFATSPLGTGPYVLDEWKPTEKLTLKANPDYWGEAPAFDEVQLIPITDNNAAEIALEANEVDFSEVALDSVDRIEEADDFDTTVVNAGAYAWVGMNTANPKLADINVRQAIRYGIDVPSILEAAYAGKATQARSPIPEGVLGHWDDAPLYARDVKKAKEYLAAANITSLELKLAIENTAEYRTWAEIIQQNLAEVGITVTIDSLDEATFWSLGEGEKGKAIELFAINYTAPPEPSWYTMWFTSDQIGTWNWMSWANPEFDALHKKGLVTLDNDEREEIYIKMQELWNDDVNSVWVSNQPRSYAYKSTIVPVLYRGGLAPQIREFKPAAE
jgi:peptide/nickel transport system substrate-binding protein